MQTGISKFFFFFFIKFRRIFGNNCKLCFKLPRVTKEQSFILALQIATFVRINSILQRLIGDCSPAIKFLENIAVSFYGIAEI